MPIKLHRSRTRAYHLSAVEASTRHPIEKDAHAAATSRRRLQRASLHARAVASRRASCSRAARLAQTSLCAAPWGAHHLGLSLLCICYYKLFSYCLLNIIIIIIISSIIIIGLDRGAAVARPRRRGLPLAARPGSAVGPFLGMRSDSRLALHLPAARFGRSG